MSLAESFHELRGHVDSSDDAITKTADQRSEEIEVQLEQVRRKADTHAAGLRTRAHDTGTDADSQWKKMQEDWDRHIAKIRQRVDAKKAQIDAADAEDQAEGAEADAMDAIAFATSAIVEAEYAAIDAILARRNAKVLSHSA